MRIITFILASLSLTFTYAVQAKDSGKHLFILSGQSNMARMDPAISFTPTVEKTFGKDKVIVVKHAQGGAPILSWYKGKKPGGLYDQLMAKVNKAIEGKTIKTITFVWMQGESDSGKNADNAKNYAKRLRGILEQLRADLKTKDVNVVIGRISDHSDKKRFPNWEKVRKALVEVAESESSGTWVSTDDLNDIRKRSGEVHNDLHYSRDGYKKLGQRFAEKAIELIKKTEKDR